MTGAWNGDSWLGCGDLPAVGAVFYLGAGRPQWKPLGIPGTHLPLKRGNSYIRWRQKSIPSFPADKLEIYTLWVSDLISMVFSNVVSKIPVNCEYQCVIWRVVVVFLLSIITCGLQFIHKILLRMSQTTNFLCTLTCQYLLLVLMSLNILLNLQMMLQLWKKTVNLKISKNSIVIHSDIYIFDKLMWKYIYLFCGDFF